MKLNPLVLFGLAGALGLAGFLATQQYLSGQEDERKVPVLVARTEIRVGDPITQENSGFKEIAVSALPPEPITEPEQFEGSYAGSRFLPGEVMVQGKVAAQFGNDSRSIPRGMRVHTTSVDKTKSHAGLLRPGDRVDVMGSFDVSERDPVTGRSERFKQIKIVLGDVEVWAVGTEVVGADQSGSDREGKKDTSRKDSATVSLVVDPTQAVRLAGAESAGTLFLSLRHPDDDTDPGDISFTTSDLYGDKKDQNARPQASAEETAPVATVAPAAPDTPAAPAAPPTASQTDGALAAFLAAEESGAAVDAEVAEEKGDVPTWTVTLHVGGDVQMNEVVDVPAAREAGFTDAEIASKQRELRDPNYANRVAAERSGDAARVAANPLERGLSGGLSARPPAGPPAAPVATGSSDRPEPAVDGTPPSAGDDDGLFALPAP